MMMNKSRLIPTAAKTDVAKSLPPSAETNTTVVAGTTSCPRSHPIQSQVLIKHRGNRLDLPDLVRLLLRNRYLPSEDFLITNGTSDRHT